MSIKQIIFSNLIIIYSDNQKTIKFTNNLIFQKRIKYINVKYHYTRNLIKHENVELSYKSINQIIVDELTKSLKSILFEKFVTSLNMIIIIEILIFTSNKTFFSRTKHFSQTKINFLQRIIPQSIKNEEHEKHIIKHDKHNEHIIIKKHFQKHDERCIKTHVEETIIDKRRIKARRRHLIIEEYQTSEYFNKIT